VTRSRRSSTAIAAILATAAVTFLAGCGAAEVSFDPRGACVVDGRAPGAYPELEELVPHALASVAPTRVDSGRSCTSTALSTYRSHGIAELHYAGATWDEGGGDGTAIAVLATPSTQPQLQQAWVEEFYLAGAQASTKTENIEVSRPTIDGAEVYRLQTLNDLSLQTVLIWSEGGPVRVVIVATQVEPGASRVQHEARVAAALQASRLPPGG
jgi:hypothetical protein